MIAADEFRGDMAAITRTQASTTTPQERLQQARRRAGFRSARAAALEMGWPESTYRAHEAGTRNYDRDTARIYARAYGVDPKSLYLDEDDYGSTGGLAATVVPPQPPMVRQRDEDGIPFAGLVEAGTWREIEDLDQTPARLIHRPRDQRFRDARQYVWQVVGDSMDMAHMPDGIFVLAIDYSDFVARYGVLNDGRFVIVERRDGARRERTVKQIRIFRDRMELQPRSSNDRHQPIVVPINHEVDGDTDIRILAVVAEAFWQF